MDRSNRHARLVQAIQQNRRAMRPLLEQRNEILTLTAGHRFLSMDGELRKQPIPAMATFISLTTRELVNRNPIMSVTTKVREYRHFAKTYEAALNQSLEEMGFYLTLQRLVFDALTSFAVASVGLEVAVDSTDDHWQHTRERPFIDRISPDDFVIDMSAATWQRASLMGHWYTLGVDEFRRSGIYENTAGIDPSRPDDRTEGGVPRAEFLGHTEPAEELNVDDRVVLLDLFLPTKRELVTLALQGTRDGGSYTEVRREAWSGPEEGPYLSLSLGLELPLAPIAMPPASMIAELHVLQNFLWNKISAQAKAAKRVNAVQSGNEDDAKALNEADDGEFTRITASGEVIRPTAIGGPDQQIFALALSIKQLFSYYAGNLDARGGLAPQSGTVGQEELIQQSASKLVASMGEDIQKFCQLAGKRIGSYLWASDERILVSREWEGMEFTDEFGPNSKVGEFPNYAFDVVPSSMVQKTPSQRANELEGFVSRLVVPMLPQLAESGETFDVAAFIRTIGKLRGITELDDMLIPSAGSLAMERTDPARQPKAATSHRTYERVNRKSENSTQREQAIADSLMGLARQENEVPGSV